MKNIRKVELPERVKRLPQYKGIPIPALTFVDDKGVPNFKLTNDKVWELKKNKKCGICGEPLEYYIAFMVSPNEAETRLVYESPNHVDCLKWAFQVCPWLYYSKASYTKAEDVKIEGVITVDAHPDRETTSQRPEKLGIYVCKNYENVIKKGYRICKVGKPVSIEWIEGH